MADEQVVTTDSKTMPLNDLKAQIESQVEVLNNPQPPVIPNLAPVVIETPTQGQVSEVKENKPEEQTSSDGVKPQVETKSESGATFEELQKQTGVRDADSLAKNYKELQKKLTQQAQELKKLHTQETQKPVEQPKQPDDYIKTQEDIYFEQRIKEVGTVKALAELNALLNKPVLEKVKDDEFRNAIQGFASSPDTADFYLPEVQAEIHKLVQERPRQFADEEGRIYPEALKDLYWMAKGRVSLVRAGIPNMVSQKPIPVEGRNKNIGTQVQGDPQKMSLTDLENLIRSKQE